MAAREHTAKFILRGEDRTRAAIKSAERHFKEFTHSVFNLRSALVGLGGAFAVREVTSKLIHANVAAQGIHFTLEAALGSSKAANREFKFLAQTADSLGGNLREGARGFALLAASAKASHIPLKTIEALYVGINKEFAILHSTQPQQQRALLALDEIMSMGVAHTRQLMRQIPKALPGSGIVPKLEEVLGLSPQEFEKALKSDQMTADRIIPAIARVLNDVNVNALRDSVHSLNADLNRLHNAIFETEIGAGKAGFLSGIEKAIDTLTATIKDPGVQAALGKLATWLGDAAAEGVQATATIVQVADALAGASNTAGKSASNFEGIRDVIFAIAKGAAFTDYWLHRMAATMAYVAAQYSNSGRNMPSKANDYNVYGYATSVSEGSASINQAYQQDLASFEKRFQAQMKRLDTAYRTPTTHVAGLKLPKIKLPSVPQLGAQGKAAADAADRAKAYKQEHDWVMNLIDPLYRLRREQERLDMDHEQGIISDRQYTAGLKKIGAEMDRVRETTGKAADATNQFAVQAAHNIQDILGNTILNVFEGKGNIFSNFADQFAQMIKKLIAQILALHAASALFGPAFASGKSNSIGGLLGALLPSIFGGGGAGAGGGSGGGSSVASTAAFHVGFLRSGGIVGGAAAHAGMVPALAWAGAPQFAAGGFPGLAPDAVPIIAHKGEEVLSRGDARNALNGGLRQAGMTVYINAQGAGPDETAKVVGFGAQLRRMWRADYKHHQRFGDFPP